MAENLHRFSAILPFPPPIFCLSCFNFCRDTIFSLPVRSDFFSGQNFDIPAALSKTTILQYMWYGESPFQIHNGVERAFYEPIKITFL